jgi:hypothetical protein
LPAQLFIRIILRNFFYSRLLRIVSSWKPQTSNRLIFSQRPEKYDLFRRPERYLLDPYDKATTEAVMQTPWEARPRQSLLQKCIDTVNEASTTQLEGPLWLKAEGKKSWKKFHFILRDGNLFQTTKSKKGSVHDVHCVASLATVRVFNGIGWKRKHKSPTDFCFAMKPPEVQEKKNHIRYLCAENEFIKWGWYSMLRLTLGPPQQLVDNYNAQLGVLPAGLARSESMACSMSSGCVSEADEENGFDIDYPDGGTIKRKPQHPQHPAQQVANGPDEAIHLPLPPSPQDVDVTPTDSSLPLPPPPLIMANLENNLEITAIREELYPCGVTRTQFPRGSIPSIEDVANNGNQMCLLQQLPSQPPPNLQSLLKTEPRTGGIEASSEKKRTRKITFSEYVQCIEDSEWEPLKGKEDVGKDEEGYNEQDVSNWVLESLRHCSGPSTAASTPANSALAAAAAAAAELARPKIYNGRSVPNCFSPEEVQHAQLLVITPPAAATTVASVLRKLPPPPPRRSTATHLS